MINLVIDTNVLVSALWSENGTPYKIMQMIPNGRFKICFCEDIMIEYKTVLSRPNFGFKTSQVDNLLLKIVKFGKNINVNKSSIVMPDEDDRKFYDVAKESGAILITGNLKHFPKEKFIMSPKDFLLKYI
ncbi:MAG: putative toxin-antitoxin system toxin component, PIN family [Oscillospiraceae bacterium]|jgi:putative PIN family toxin of toxin-antitoxin system|nr:putative toxin-antitoxin system toxin component, PIN family [Oscillospiraceae bacterium]